MSAATDSTLSAPPGSALARIDNALGWLVALPSAALVAVEVVLLFTGVIARYVFHKPLIVADELSSVLFLWLAMMGAAVALHRNAHMRMTALVNGSNDAWRVRWDWAAWTACLCFLALLAGPSISYLMQQREIELPGLSISDGWRAAAMPVATLLMIVITLVKLFIRGAREALSAAVIAVLLAVALQVVGPVLADLGNLNLVIFFIGIVGTAVMLGMPIAFAFGLATFSYLSLSDRKSVV